MTTEINVLSRTQIIRVEPVTKSISIINAGPPGPGGAIGSATGSVILVGTAAPTIGDGAVGNYWIDTTNDVLYGPKAASGTIWPIALYGAQTPPALLGEERRTTNPTFSSTFLPVSIDLPVATRLQVFLNVYTVLQAEAVYAFDCRVDATTVGRFAWLTRNGINYVSASVLIPVVAAGVHTISMHPNRHLGTGNCAFEASATMPAYLSVYKDRM